MVEIGCCASAGMMSQLTDPPSVVTERRSWTPTEADEPGTRPEKPGTPTTDRSGLPVGLGSSGNNANLDGGFLDPPSTARPELTEPCPFSETHLDASC
jgi:hypothetical protein